MWQMGMIQGKRLIIEAVRVAVRWLPRWRSPGLFQRLPSKCQSMWRHVCSGACGKVVVQEYTHTGSPFSGAVYISRKEGHGRLGLLHHTTAGVTGAGRLRHLVGHLAAWLRGAAEVAGPPPAASRLAGWLSEQQVLQCHPAAAAAAARGLFLVGNCRHGVCWRGAACSEPTAAVFQSNWLAGCM